MINTKISHIITTSIMLEYPIFIKDEEVYQAMTFIRDNYYDKMITDNGVLVDWDNANNVYGEIINAVYGFILVLKYEKFK